MGVSVTVENDVVILTIDNPPVNALSASVREALLAALEDADNNPSIKALIVTGAGKNFIGGADIKEFGAPPVPPFLPDVLNRLERSRVVTIAAINGAALGGGLETALACRYRVAAPAAKLGLPEVRIGLIPGAGGTQRLPRLIGLKRAAEMIASGKPVAAEEAVQSGLVDGLAQGDIVEAAMERVRALPENQARPALRDAPQPDDWDADWLDSFAEKTEARSRGQTSPLKAIEAVRAVGETSFDEGLRRERALFLDCRSSGQHKGLVHAFFGERAVAKHDVLDKASPRQVSRIGVLGAGRMGAAIVQCCADNGFDVTIFDVNEDVLDGAVETVTSNYDQLAAKGRLSPEARTARLARIHRAGSMQDFADCGLVIEAVTEKLELKQAVFAELDRIVGAETVLASNTSYLDINKMAEATARPENVVGMHFFSPANIMRLLEVVEPARVSPESLATALAVGKRLGKICVPAKVSDGFIGNRLFKAYRRHTEYLIEEGALPQDVDRAMRDFGFAMGPCEVFDLAGIDIGWLNRRREDETRDPDERYVDIADRLYETGRLGRKTGAGWYAYPPGSRAEPDPVVEEIIIEASRRSGVARRAVSAEEIRNRLMFVLVNEGVHVLSEGVARSALDIDMTFIHGYGFPAWRGGPMYYADAIGLKALIEPVRSMFEADPASWRPSPVLLRMAEEGARLSDI